MTRVLLTAFKPYDQWPTNASWLALVELTQEMPCEPEVVTRLYPVDFDEVRRQLQQDLAEGFDYTIHIGQAPGATKIQLESVGINVGGNSTQPADQHGPLVEDGPVAYQSGLPLSQLTSRLREQGIPAQVSFHAGTFLCNATLYLAHHFIAQQGLPTRSTFVHLPLDVSQTIDHNTRLPSLPARESARAIKLILEELVGMQLN